MTEHAARRTHFQHDNRFPYVRYFFYEHFLATQNLRRSAGHYWVGVAASRYRITRAQCG